MNQPDDGFDNLDAGGRLAAGLTRRPALLVQLSLGSALVLSWLMLATMARRTAEVGAGGLAGPGAELVKLLPEMALPTFIERFLALCLSPVPASGFAAGEFAALAAMWFLMSLAMMLPAAAPMVRTYCEIAETAARKGERVAHPLMLVAGYLSVWLLASMGFAALAAGLRFATAGDVAVAPLTGIAASVALGLAGLYQFSALKHACLKKCRRPFSILFSRWSPRGSAIFRLGAEQGVWCLGCCWALMLVMLAVGLMNLFWMALIGLFVLVEKQGSGRLSTVVAGWILLVWAALLLVVSISGS